MRVLREELRGLLREAVERETVGLPETWTRCLRRAVPFEPLWSLSLLACASAQRCRVAPDRGLPSSAAVLLLAGATAAHNLPCMELDIPGMQGYDAGGCTDAGRILAGDAMIPLAVRLLAEEREPSSLFLAELLLTSAPGVLEAMRYGRHGHMGEHWCGRLASLSARMGAVAAGAAAPLPETAALAGQVMGEAWAVLRSHGPRTPREEAKRMMKEALEPLGPEAHLFREIGDFIADPGTDGSDDLFSSLETY